MKLLLVDDNQSLCEMYTILFTASGYEVKTSPNGLAAITDAVDFKPDIVLLDILMPEMSGYGFLDALNNNTSMRPVVIILSNLGEQVEIDRALGHGADAYLQKSDYVGKTLVEKVQKLYKQILEKRHTEEQSQKIA